MTPLQKKYLEWVADGRNGPAPNSTGKTRSRSMGGARCRMIERMQRERWLSHSFDQPGLCVVTPAGLKAIGR